MGQKEIKKNLFSPVNVDNISIRIPNLDMGQVKGKGVEVCVHKQACL